MSKRRLAAINTIEDAQRFARQHAYSEWDTYDVSWTAASGTPYQGSDGLLAGRYFRNEYICWVRVSMTYGSSGTPSPGTGAWAFSLPVQPVGTFSTEGSVILRDAGTNFRTGTCVLEGNQGERILRAYIDSTASAVGAGVPITWANNDYLRMTIWYPIK